MDLPSFSLDTLIFTCSLNHIFPYARQILKRHSSPFFQAQLHSLTHSFSIHPEWHWGEGWGLWFIISYFSLPVLPLYTFLLLQCGSSMGCSPLGISPCSLGCKGNSCYNMDYLLFLWPWYFICSFSLLFPPFLLLYICSLSYLFIFSQMCH